MGVVALSSEEGVLPDSHFDHQVTIDMSFPSEPKRRPVIDPLRKLDLLLRLYILHTLPFTVGTGVRDCLTHPLTSLTLSLHHHDSLPNRDVTRPATGLAFLGFATRFGP